MFTTKLYRCLPTTCPLYFETKEMCLKHSNLTHSNTYQWSEEDIVIFYPDESQKQKIEDFIVFSKSDHEQILATCQINLIQTVEESTRVETKPIKRFRTYSGHCDEVFETRQDCLNHLSKYHLDYRWTDTDVSLIDQISLPLEKRDRSINSCQSHKRDKSPKRSSSKSINLSHRRVLSGSKLVKAN